MGLSRYSAGRARARLRRARVCGGGRAPACLTPEERNAAIAARKAVPLGRAMRVVQARIGGEVVGARLCRQEPKGLVYVLTVLARNGKVTQARVDAADGHWLGGG